MKRPDNQKYIFLRRCVIYFRFMSDAHNYITQEPFLVAWKEKPKESRSMLIEGFHQVNEWYSRTWNVVDSETYFEFGLY